MEQRLWLLKAKGTGPALLCAAVPVISGTVHADLRLLLLLPIDLCSALQLGGVIAGLLYIAIEEMQFPGGGSRGGGLFVG